MVSFKDLGGGPGPARVKAGRGRVVTGISRIDLGGPEKQGHGRGVQESGRRGAQCANKGEGSKVEVGDPPADTQG